MLDTDWFLRVLNGWCSESKSFLDLLCYKNNECSAAVWYLLIFTLFLSVGPFSKVKIKSHEIQQRGGTINCSHWREAVWQPSTALWVINQCYWHPSTLHLCKWHKPASSAGVLTRSQMYLLQPRPWQSLLTLHAHIHMHKYISGLQKGQPRRLGPSPGCDVSYLHFLVYCLLAS